MTAPTAVPNRPVHPATHRRSRPVAMRRFAAATLVLSCSACSSFAPPSAANLGLSLREAQTLQTQPPGLTARGVPGLDGAAARAALQRYEQSSETPARSAPVFNIGIGASTSR